MICAGWSNSGFAGSSSHWLPEKKRRFPRLRCCASFSVSGARSAPGSATRRRPRTRWPPRRSVHFRCGRTPPPPRRPDAPVPERSGQPGERPPVPRSFPRSCRGGSTLRAGSRVAGNGRQLPADGEVLGEKMDEFVQEPQHLGPFGPQVHPSRRLRTAISRAGGAVGIRSGRTRDLAPVRADPMRGGPQDPAPVIGRDATRLAASERVRACRAAFDAAVRRPST